jgi:hypothetical protein
MNHPLTQTRKEHAIVDRPLTVSRQSLAAVMNKNKIQI